jgi:tellurite resistance protein
MSINRDNYEEYFLLYADNELADSEKIEVLRFIRENPDLEDEFKMLLGTVLKPAEQPKINKSFLYKTPADALINDKNYEEYFVAWYDEELNDSEQAALEKFIKLHPHLQQEFELFGKVKLQPDLSVTFPGSEVLYKREPAKTIPLVFWRTLAAAIFIGFGLWFFWDNTNSGSLNNGNTEAVTVKNNEANLPDSDIRVGKRETAPTPETKIAVEQPKQNNLAASPAGKDKSPVSESILETAVKIEKGDHDQLAKKDLPVKGQPEVVIESDVEKVEVPELATKKLPAKDQDVAVATFTKSRIDPDSKDQEMKVIPAAMLVDADESENYVFYNITAEEFRRSKVGGFLKKVKRVVVRTSPIGRLFSDDENQMAAN